MRKQKFRIIIQAKSGANMKNNRDSFTKNITRLSDEELYTLYLTNVVPNLDNIVQYKYLGYSFSDISEELGITNSELWRMYISKKDVYLPLQKAMDTEVRDDSFTRVVETALYRKCIGFKVKEQQAIKVKHEYFNKKGKKCVDESVELVEVERYIPPEFSAQRFYLLNNSSNKYRNENKIEGSDLTTDKLIESLTNFTLSVKRKAEER